MQNDIQKYKIWRFICRKSCSVLGGLHQMEETNDSFANKDFRRARMELLYKEYEVRYANCLVSLFNCIPKSGLSMFVVASS